MQYHLTPKQVERFFSYVLVRFDPFRGDDNQPCWEWTGEKSKGGYGLFRWTQDGKLRGTSAHRIAWFIRYGQIPEGMDICHDCPDGDNRLCCNYNHAFLGTRRDNSLDTVRKGRHHSQTNPEAYRAARASHGEKHHHAKLTEDQVRDIRRRYLKENTDNLAQEYGVNRSTICAVGLRKSWKLVTD